MERRRDPTLEERLLSVEEADVDDSHDPDISSTTAGVTPTDSVVLANEAKAWGRDARPLIAAAGKACRELGEETP